jgi:hypothetical protein
LFILFASVLAQHGRSGSSKEKIILLSVAGDSICWTAGFGRRNSLFGFNKSQTNLLTTVDTEDKILVSAITQVKRGIQTDVMLKVSSRIDPACSMSLVTAERTLDLTFSQSTERDTFIRGLKMLLNVDVVEFV